MRTFRKPIVKMAQAPKVAAELRWRQPAAEWATFRSNRSVRSTNMTIWVLAADAARARIFSAEAAQGGLKEVADLVHPQSRIHARDAASDEPGTTFDRVGQGQHSMGKEVEPKDEEAIRFAKELATRLDDGRTAGQFNKLYVVAAPRFLGELRDALSEPTRKLVAAEIDKNLVAHKTEEIRAQLPTRL
jgi:protein required for attachment to host cells